jgi:hypothetical protein
MSCHVRTAIDGSREGRGQHDARESGEAGGRAPRQRRGLASGDGWFPCGVIAQVDDERYLGPHAGG